MIYNRRKDPRDERDLLHPTMAAEVLAPNSGLTPFLPDVLNQGATLGCTGFGTACQITLECRFQGSDPEQESVVWPYNIARMLEGTLTQNVGVYGRDCFDQFLKLGLLKDHDWPFAGFDPNAPSPAQLAAALLRKYPDFQYQRCVDGVSGILSALSAHHPVAIGCPWPAKWESAGPDGVLSEIVADDPTVGGHETCLYDYDLDLQVVYGQNSWGMGYAKNGRFAIPFSAFAVLKRMAMDAGSDVGYDAQIIIVTLPKFVKPPDPPVDPPVVDPVKPPVVIDPTVSPCRYGHAVATAMSRLPSPLKGEVWANVLNAFFLQELRRRKGRFMWNGQLIDYANPVKS